MRSRSFMQHVGPIPQFLFRNYLNNSLWGSLEFPLRTPLAILFTNFVGVSPILLQPPSLPKFIQIYIHIYTSQQRV